MKHDVDAICLTTISAIAVADAKFGGAPLHKDIDSYGRQRLAQRFS